MSGAISIAAALHIRTLRVPEDVDLVHDWLTTEHAKYWGMRNATRDDVARTYRDIRDSAHHEAFLGYCDDEPAFLCEWYDPAHEEVGRHFRVRDGDAGMHFLVPPPERRIPGFTHAVIGTVLDHIFGDPHVQRVVVEPDAANTKVHRLNAVAGFTVDRRIELSDKTALLSFCTRQQYAVAKGPHLS